MTDLNLEEMFDTFEAADEAVSNEEVGMKAPKTAFSAKDMPGATFPMGFWDPAQFTLDVSESQYKFYQEAELKHARVAMLAFAGIIVGELINPLFDGQITGPAAFQYQIADGITGGKVSSNKPPCPYKTIKP